MRLKSFKIPFIFLIIGILWALLSQPLLSTLDQNFSPGIRDIIRSLNHFVFVVFASIILYFEIKRQQKRLSLSEEQYRRLFEMNPNPMWVYDSATLRFVVVNNSAVELYGYTMDEFSSMTIQDIRPYEERKKLADAIYNTLGHEVRRRGTWKHLKKDGGLLYISIVAYDMNFNEKPGTLVMANDITSVILKEELIKSQNAALLEIAWLNSHKVRKSLCSVMSLTTLLKDSDSEYERKEYIGLMERCTHELDDVLKATNNRVDELMEF
ncbi:PAS domain S-box protein [Mucilaginibacter sp. McL0603]|uniref:PAS domain S-box protein n=1 Tax=Mucilaginibacter sp. McL0603 TaxID=3415670 RepID=UPI003CEEDAC1